MKLRALILALSVLYASAGQAAQTAQARLYCLSVFLNDGPDQYADKLIVNSTGGAPEAAHEIFPWPGALPPGSDLSFPTTEVYISGLWLYDSFTGNYSSGTLTIYLPQTADVNNNKYADFLESGLALNATSGGSMSYFDPIYGQQSTSINVQWTRTAGSVNGTCRITSQDPYWGTFVCPFRILEYKGSLTYTPGTNSVAATLSVTQTGSANSMQGSLQFTKSSTNKYDSLILQPGTLTTNLTSQTLVFTNHYFFRDIAWPTNYAGFVEFDNDGDQNTFMPWALWVLSIDDTNDSNHNGIPDFSDDPQGSVVLELALGPNNTLQLTIHGDTGHTYTLQDTATLSPPHWQSGQSVQLTTDPQVVSVPLPAGAAHFWRVVTQ